MRKFCFCFPLVESGIFVGVFGIVVWVLYFIHACFERSSNSNTVLTAYAILTTCGIVFEFLLIYAFIKVKLILIKAWRIYQIFLITFLTATWIYDIYCASKGIDGLLFVLLDAIFLGLEVYFMIVVRAFQKHLEIINDPIIYHPVNEFDDEAYINDYY